MKHSGGDHHGFEEAVIGGLCWCGQPEYTGVHDRPYCGDCDVTEPDPLDFGVSRWRRWRFWLLGRP